jgi:hypothetical protein
MENESNAPKAPLYSGLQLAGFLVPPLAWGADLLISYALVQHACSTGHMYVLHVCTAVFFVIALAGALVSWNEYRKASAGNDEGGSPLDRSHFLALLGTVSSIFFALVILAMAVPRWVLSPCA